MFFLGIDIPNRLRLWCYTASLNVHVGVVRVVPPRLLATAIQESAWWGASKLSNERQMPVTLTLSSSEFGDQFFAAHINVSVMLGGVILVIWRTLMRRVTHLRMVAKTRPSAGTTDELS